MKITEKQKNFVIKLLEEKKTGYYEKARNAAMEFVVSRDYDLRDRSLEYMHKWEAVTECIVHIKEEL